ncbi:MAG: serine/threonine-protein kinase [Planctomycetota bacterium]|nr:serine/threonine-protein kinase [Planctomycetota bacterium]
MERYLDLLFGMHALRLGFIDISRLLDCLAVCLASRPVQHMADVLLSRKLVTQRQVDAVDAVVRAQLTRHGNDPARAFRATELDGELRQQLVGQLERAGKGSQTPTALAQLKRSVSKAHAAATPTSTVYVTRAPAGKYSLAEKLGEGGLGTVMMAMDNDIGRPIAIKFVRRDVPDQFLERFRRESIVTGRLEHPNIVPVHDIGMMDMATGKDDCAGVRAGRGRIKKTASKRQLYMAMKLIKGRDLGEVLRSILEGDRQATDKWPLRRLVEAFHSVCNAIAYAHSQGIIHRDLKPSNIMIGEFGEVLVVDWGLAKVAGEQDLHEETAPRREKGAGRVGHSKSRVSDLLESSLRTIEGAVMGTPQYMPPEQAAGRVSQIDERSDIYSLGAILYEILTFCPPFEGATSREVLMKVLTEDLARPTERLQSERDWFRNVGRPVAGRGTTGPTKGVTVEPVASCPAAFEKQVVPPELEDICMKCLAKRKKERYQSALELGEEIRLYLEGAKERERRHELAEAAVAEGRKLVKTYFLLKETAAVEKKERARGRGQGERLPSSGTETGTVGGSGPRQGRRTVRRHDPGRCHCQTHGGDRARARQRERAQGDLRTLLGQVHRRGTAGRRNGHGLLPESAPYLRQGMVHGQVEGQWNARHPDTLFRMQMPSSGRVEGERAAGDHRGRRRCGPGRTGCHPP